MTAHDPQSWIMQLRGDARAEFDLPGAVERALAIRSTIWLTNRQYGDSIMPGDQVYLWSSRVRGRGGKFGRLIATSTVRQPSQPHEQHPWQAEFRRPAIR